MLIPCMIGLYGADVSCRNLHTCAIVGIRKGASLGDLHIVRNCITISENRSLIANTRIEALRLCVSIIRRYLT